MTPRHLTGVERRRAHPTTDVHRNRATGNHLPRRLLLRVPRVLAHPKEQAEGAGVSCSVGGGERGGGRSSGADGFGGRERGRGRYGWLRVRGDALSTLVCSDAGCSAHGRVNVIAGGDELTAS